MDRMDKGVLIKELLGTDPNSRTKWMIIYSDLLVMPLIFTLVLLFSYDAFASIGMLVPVVIVLYTLPFLSYLMMQHIFGRYLLTAYVYSEGIQLPVSWLSRIARLPTFVRKDEIAEFSTEGVAAKDETGPFERQAHFSLKTKAGKSYFVGYRNPQEMRVVSEYMKREWRANVTTMDNKAKAHSPFPGDPGQRPAGPANTRPLFCNNCGGRLNEGYEFCPLCGNKAR